MQTKHVDEKYKNEGVIKVCLGYLLYLFYSIIICCTYIHSSKNNGKVGITFSENYEIKVLIYIMLLAELF